MNYQRVLVLVELGADSRPAFTSLRRFAPSAARAMVIAQQPARQIGWLTPAVQPELDDERALDELRAAASQAAPAVDLSLVSELSSELLAHTAAAEAIDLVIAGALPTQALSLVAELCRRRSLPLLFAKSPLGAAPPEGGNRLLCVGLSARGRRAIVKFLKEQAAPGDRTVLLSSTALSPNELSDLREVAGIDPEVELSDAWDQPLRWLLAAQSRPGIELIVLPQLPPLVLLGVTPAPALLALPPLEPAAREWQLAIDVPDLIDDGARIRVRIEYAVGPRVRLTDQELAFVHEGKIVARVTSRDGEVELPSGLGNSLGVFRTNEREDVDPLALVEAGVAILRPDSSASLLLFDAEIDDDRLPLIRAVAWAEPVGVRVRSTSSCAALRARLRSAGLPPHVIDAGAVLGEGAAGDVPAQADAVRLARVAARLRADGFPVHAIVHRGPHRPAARGFAAVRATELAALREPQLAARRSTSLAERLAATTGSEPIPDNRIEIELDNRMAREWLLAAIDGSRERLHVQSYMAADDDVGRAVEAALAAAAARGVAVRVLVDSLHGMHGSLGVRNPVLERLAAHAGVELRVSKPLTGLPSLEELKQRDHRKLVVADGQLALLGGRNLSHEYYTGFEEVALARDVNWRTVPWLDAGARVAGPAVAALERSYLRAWTEAGGAPFEIRVPAPAGPSSARVVVHRGLDDAYTLEAYLALIETARSHITVVNGFPLLLEIQHALLRALRRGVRVRTLFGNLSPRHGEELFKGPWAVARSTATSLVHSRMDALVAAGGECYELVVRHQPAWHPALADVRPHVHAKVMSADARVCAVGSANLDITASYWESDLLLVVEDAALSAQLEARVEGLLAASDRVDRDDPEWRRRAGWRQWMRYWPGTLSP